MSQIWLRCAILAPESGNVVEQWEDYRLPENLQIQHLQSYLEQRFGRSLAINVGEAKAITFAARRGLGPEGSVLVAIPLMRDPDSGEVVSIFKRLATVDQLAEPWIGPLVEPTHVRQATNDAAARAARAWIIAAGLAAEIESVRGEQVNAPPAPGLAQLVERADRAATQAAADADPAWNLCEKVKRCSAAIGTTSALEEVARDIKKAEERLLDAYRKTLRSLSDAESASRALAQLGFGVSALTSGGARVERLERTCVAVLHPPGGHGVSVPLVDDGVSLVATTRDDLLVEIAGILCRLLIDRGARVILRVPGAGDLGIDFIVETGDTLAAYVSPGMTVLARWPSPVTVSKPAKLAVDRLVDTLGLERPSDLVVTVERRSRDAPLPMPEAPQGTKGWVM